MINLFRNTRQNLIGENKTSKYLQYAFGEIILVVIGILLAVQLNNLNEQRKKEKTFKTNLEQVTSDLKLDLVQANVAIDFYTEKASLIKLVLSNQVTKEMYRENRNLRRLITNYSPFKPNKTGFDALLRNIDDIPDNFTSVINVLEGIHSDIQNDLQISESVLLNSIEKVLDNWTNNFDWYSTSIPGTPVKEISEKELDYLLNDPIYKNFVTNYLSASKENLIYFLQLYRQESFNALIMIRKNEKKNTDDILNELRPFMFSLQPVYMKPCLNEIEIEYLQPEWNYYSTFIIKNELKEAVKIYSYYANGHLDKKRFHTIEPDGLTAVFDKQDYTYLVVKESEECLGTFKTPEKDCLFVIN